MRKRSLEKRKKMEEFGEVKWRQQVAMEIARERRIVKELGEVKRRRRKAMERAYQK